MASNGSRTLIGILREYSFPLILGVITALIWANTGPESYRAFIKTPIAGTVSLYFIVNEIFMVFFFGIAAVEIMTSVLPGGSLNPPRKAVNPLLATAGGVLGPVGLYLLLNALFGGPELFRGWGITTATDIALAWLVARFVFGNGHPAVSFLLLLAVADDAIGLVIIAIFYPDPTHPVNPAALGMVAVGMAVAFGLRKLGVRTYWHYLILAGSLTWLGLFWAHLHPALALVFVVPFMPARLDIGETPADAGPPLRDRNTLLDFEHQWKIVVEFGLFFFGIANAGVSFSAVGTITWMVFASLLVGKTVGIFACSWIGSKLGFALPAGMTFKDLFLAGMVAGIGLTVALFVAGAAFPDKPEIQGMAKMGALASALIAPLALVAGRLMRGSPGKVELGVE